MKQKQRARLSHQQYAELSNYLNNRAHEGVIPERVGSITAEATRVLGFEVAKATVRTACKANEIALIWNVPNGKKSQPSCGDHNLEVRLDRIEAALEVLMTELGVKERPE